MSKKFAYLTTILILLFPWLISAHGSVSTLTQTSDGFTLEFEYSSLSNIKAGDITQFDTYLLDANKNPVDFDSVYIEIVDSTNNPVYYGTYKEASDVPGSARMGGIIKDPGPYTATVQFTKSGKTISANYNFTVDPALTGGSAKQLTQDQQTIVLEGILVVGGFVLGFAVRSVYKKQK